MTAHPRPTDYPSDVLCGSALGYALGALMEGGTLSVAASGRAKVVGGIIITASWGLYYFIRTWKPIKIMTEIVSCRLETHPLTSDLLRATPQLHHSSDEEGGTPHSGLGA